MVAALSEGLDGRAVEREAVFAVLDRAAHGTVGVYLYGEAGIGKSTLLEAGAGEAVRRGFTVFMSRSVASEVTLPFVGLGDLFGTVGDGVFAGLSAPRADALAGALGRREPTHPPETRLLGHALVAIIRCLTEEVPLVLVLDDVQWLDASSAAALDFALRRLTVEPVAVLATFRTEPGEWPPAVPGERFELLPIGPLSLGALQRVLRSRLETPITRPRARRIHQESGGNPFYALELARAGDAFSATLSSLVGTRIAALPAESRELLATLAFAARPTSRLAAALGSEEALEAAERARVVVAAGDEIRFAHPLLAAAAREAATSSERRRAHLRLASLVDDPVERAHHLGFAHDAPDEIAAEALDGAARIASGRGASTVAAELAEAALRLTPDYHPDLWRRAVAAARRCRTIGDTARERAILDKLLIECDDPERRAEALWLLAALAGDEGDGATARTLISRSRDLANDDALAASICLDAVWLEGGIGGAVDPAKAALEHAERSGEPSLVAEALSAVAYTSFSHGLGFRPELFERAVELEAEAEFVETAKRPSTRFGLVAKWAGDLPLSRRLLEAAAERASAEEDASATVVLYYLAWLHLIAGEWERGLDRADEAYEVAVDAGREGDAAAARITRGILLAHLGRFDEVRLILDETLATVESLHSAYAVLWGWAGAIVASIDGDPATAASLLEPAVSDLRRRGLDEPGYHPWLPTCLDALLDAGRVDDAEDLLLWFSGHAGRLGCPWARAVAAHFEARLATGRGEPDALSLLERALELHERTGRPFDRAKTLLLYGETLRRAKQKRAAREALTTALAELERLGAAHWAARARDGLARIGGRAPAGGLTPSELRMTELVSSGKSNKAIAAELTLSVRTVETTLSRIYRKLGLLSRGELAAWAARQ